MRRWPYFIAYFAVCLAIAALTAPNAYDVRSQTVLWAGEVVSNAFLVAMLAGFWIVTPIYIGYRIWRRRHPQVEQVHGATPRSARESPADIELDGRDYRSMDTAGRAREPMFQPGGLLFLAALAAAIIVTALAKDQLRQWWFG